MRAKFQDAVAVLGSATPSLESYYNAKSGKYRYLHMANRVDHRPMPEVAVVDRKVLPKSSLYSPLFSLSRSDNGSKRTSRLSCS